MLTKLSRVVRALGPVKSRQLSALRGRMKGTGKPDAVTWRKARHAGKRVEAALFVQGHLEARLEGMR